MSGATLVTDDGVRLAARWWRPRGSVARREVVVVVHGFCASKDAPAVELLALRQTALGRPTLTFDLRGHGGSDGETTLGLHEGRDVDAAVAAASVHADRVVVIASSMGGVATIEHLCEAAGPGDADAAAVTEGSLAGMGGRAAIRGTGGRPGLPVPPGGLRAPGRADGAVVVATPAHWQVPRSARGVLAVALTQTRAGRALAARSMGTRVAVRPGRGDEPVVRARSVTRPVAVVHGLADRFVAPSAGRALYAALGGPRLLDLVPGMGHGFCPAAADPIDDAVEWLVAAFDEESVPARPSGGGSRPASGAGGRAP